MGKRKLVALLSLSSCCLLMVVWLFLSVPWVCLLFVIVVISDHTPYFQVVNTLYTFFTRTRILVTLKHDLNHWIISEYELEKPLTRSHAILEFDHEIISQ